MKRRINPDHKVNLLSCSQPDNLLVPLYASFKLLSVSLDLDWYYLIVFTVDRLGNIYIIYLHLAISGTKLSGLFLSVSDLLTALYLVWQRYYNYNW